MDQKSLSRKEAIAQAQQIPITTANTFLQRVFVIMAAGLGITGLVAYVFSTFLEGNQALQASLFGGIQGILIMLAPLAFVLVLSFGINRLSYFTATLIFAAFAVVMGISLSSIFLVYTGTSIALTFFVTAGLFGFMAIYGLTTSKDLTKLGTYLFFGLIGIIIASVVNWFLGSSLLQFLISIGGVIIFTGLTAYDVQRIMVMSLMGDHNSEAAKKASLMGALSLYLDFINLFLFLLQLLGSRE